LKLLLANYGKPDKGEFRLQNGESANIAEIFHCVPQDARAWSQRLNLEWRTSRIRSTIESLGDEESLDDTNRDLMCRIYGTRLFKCSRIECNHFIIDSLLPNQATFGLWREC